MSAPCVLVVEDEPLIRDLLVAGLCDAGYLVIAVADAREADEACRDYHIDIAFVDIRRPGAPEGWAVAEHLRERHPECPIVYASVGQASHQAPFAYVLRRPFSMAEALQTIAQVTGKPAGDRYSAAAPATRTPDALRPSGCPAAHGERLAL